MRIKKGFTLAEILIVLMVIGVIATMTIPSLMKGVNDATYKTAFKKAYNTITNIAAVSKVSGDLPAASTTASVEFFFKTLDSNLSVKEYSVKTLGDNEGVPFATSDTSPALTYNSVNYGATATTDTPAVTQATVNNESPWIVTEDGFAYKVLKGADTTCGSKAQIMAQKDAAEAAKKSCLIIAVDVNGLFKLPNKLEDQVVNGLNSGDKTGLLIGDRYYIFVGSDGTSTGPKATTISGRLLNDVK